MTAASAPPRLDERAPWPGLGAFTEEDHRFFRGRDREADELARLVRRERLTVLFGRSGLGKTSLLGAGLFPRLRDGVYLPVLLRVGYAGSIAPREQVWAALATACAQAEVEASAPRAGETLWQHFHRAGAGFWNARNRPLTPVLVFDQFEELFTVGQADDASRSAAAAFVDELACLVEDRIPEPLRTALDADPARAGEIDFARRSCKIVLSFREDFLAEVEGLRGPMPSLMRNRYRLLPMNGLQAREVVHSSQLVDADVAARILGLAWRNRAVAPPEADYERLEIDPALLSVICTELNLRRLAAGQPRIGGDLLAGAESEILGDFYERSLADTDTRLRAFVEDELITEAGFRDSFAYDDALSQPGVTGAAVQRLVDGRLLRVDERFGVRRLELTHDVLTRVVKDSRDARKAREAEAAAAAREAAAHALQRRNRRNVAWIGAAGVVALALIVGSVIAIVTAIRASRSNVQAKLESEAARRESEQAAGEARQATALLSAMAASAAAANQVAVDATLRSQEQAVQAATAVRRASDATARADELTHEARAADLVVNMREMPPSDADRALLLGAEAIRLYPGRLGAQVDQFARLQTLSAVHRLLQPQGRATVSAVGRSGNLLVVGTEKGQVVVIDTAAWQVLRHWRASNGAIDAIALSADGRTAATASLGQGIVWDVATGNGRDPVSFASGVRSLLWADDGTRIAVAGQRYLALWQPGKAAVTLGRYAVDCVGFLPAADQLLVAATGRAMGFDGSAAKQPVWSTELPKGKRQLSADCRTGAFLRDATAGRSVVDFVALRDGRLLATTDPFEVADNQPATFVRSSDGRAVAVGPATAPEIWDLESPRRLRPALADERIESLAISEDRSWIAVTRLPDNANAGVRTVVSNLQRALPSLTLELPAVGSRPLLHVVGSMLVSLNTDGLLANWLWKVYRLQRPPMLMRDGEPLYIEVMEFNATGTAAAISESGGGLSLWNVGSSIPPRRYQQAKLSEFSPRGRLVALLLHDGTVEWHDTTAGDALKRSFSAVTETGDDKPQVTAMAFSHDDRRFAAGLSDGALLVWQVDSAAPPRRIPASGKAAIRSLAFNLAGDQIAAALDDGGVLLIGTDAGAARRLDTAHDDAGHRVAFSPDGRLLASGGDDGVAILHDPVSGRLVARLAPHEGEVGVLAFSADGQILIAGPERGARQVWDVAKQRLLTRLGGQGGARIEPNPYSRQAAIIEADETVHLRRWDAGTMQRDACELAGRNLTCDEWHQYLPDTPYHATCTSNSSDRSAPAAKCAAVGAARR